MTKHKSGEATSLKGTKEFYELMDQFEKDVKKITYGHKVEREQANEKLPVNIFYQDGYINTLFLAYMRGYVNGKWTERMGI